MKKNKTKISKSSSYEGLGSFWDKNDLMNFKTKEVNFDIDIQKEKTYCLIDKGLSVKLEQEANKKGITPDILVNLILQKNLKSA